MIAARRRKVVATAFTLFHTLVLVSVLQAQTARQAWLRFSKGNAKDSVPLLVKPIGKGALERSAADELRSDLVELYGPCSTDRPAQT